MKVLLVSLLAIAVVSGRTTIQPGINWEGPECPIDDPLHLVQAAVNVTFDPVLKLLVGSSVEDFVLSGLKTFRYNFWINELGPWFNFEVNIPQVTGNGAYNAEGYLDARPFREETFPSGNLTGSGLAQLSATNVKIRGTFAYYLNMQDQLQFSRISIQEVSFDTLELDLGPNFRIGGEPVNWPELNRNIKSNFDRDFAENRIAIEGRLREAYNIIIKDYSLQDLIDLLPGNDPRICPL